MTLCSELSFSFKSVTKSLFPSPAGSPRSGRNAASELTAEQLLQLSHEQQLIMLGDGGFSSSSSSSSHLTAYACQGRRLQIACPNDADVIRIVRANYGRSVKKWKDGCSTLPTWESYSRCVACTSEKKTGGF